MEFPVLLRLGPLALHPHWVLEILSYLAGIGVYLWLRGRVADPVTPEHRSAVITAAAVGAAVGGKLVYWLADPALTLEHWNDLLFLMAGKSIVGALVGGLIAVESTKRWLGITQATGDLFAVPLAVGIAIGRIGCFLTGLDDHTHGLPANLPWAVDYGDGILRHPAQLYEIAFLLVFAGVLWRMLLRPHIQGDVFKTFLAGYLAFRFGLEFLKPGVAFAGLNVIQWICLGGLLYYARLLALRARPREVLSG